MGFRVLRSDGAHEYVYRRLANCGEEDVAASASVLSSLRSERNDADYNLASKSDSGGDARYHVERAQKVIEQLVPYRTEVVRKQQVKEGIQRYEASISGRN